MFGRTGSRLNKVNSAEKSAIEEDESSKPEEEYEEEEGEGEGEEKEEDDVKEKKKAQLEQILLAMRFLNNRRKATKARCLESRRNDLYYYSKINYFY